MGTARRHLSSIIESEGTNVYSLEMSMLGYKLDRKSDKIHPYTEDHCRDIITIYQQLYVAPCADIQQGRSICRALYDFYKISGHIETVTDPEEEELVRAIIRASNKGS